MPLSLFLTLHTWMLLHDSSVWGCSPLCLFTLSHSLGEYLRSRCSVSAPPLTEFLSYRLPVRRQGKEVHTLCTCIPMPPCCRSPVVLSDPCSDVSSTYAELAKSVVREVTKALFAPATPPVLTYHPDKCRSPSPPSCSLFVVSYCPCMCLLLLGLLLCWLCALLIFMLLLSLPLLLPVGAWCCAL